MFQNIELSKTKQNIVAIALYTFLFFIYFNELFSHFSSALITEGKYLDIIQVYWNTWHFSERVLSFQNPFYTDSLLYPKGASLFMHAYTPFFGIINIFVQNPIVSINTGILLQFVMGSFFAYKLSSLFVKNNIYRLMIGAMYMFNLYILNKSTIHYNLILISLCPLIIYFFIKAFNIENQKLSINKKYFYLAITIVIINFLFDYYALFYSLSFLILYFLYFFYFQNWLSNINYKKIILFVVVILIAHIGLRLMRITGVDENGAIWAASDTRSFVLPLNSNIYSEFLQINTDEVYENSLFITYGLLVGFLLTLFIKGPSNDKSKHLHFFLFSIIIYALVSSPVFKVNGKDWFYFPTGIIHFIPFVNNVRAPSRFIEMLFLLIPIYIFIKVESNTLLNKTAQILAVSLFLIITIENKLYAKSIVKYSNNPTLNYDSVYRDNSFMYKMNSVNMVDEQMQINKIIPQGSAVVNIPFGVRDGFKGFGFFNEKIYVYQYLNKLKTSSGYFSRVDESTWQHYKSINFYNQLVSAQNDSLYTSNVSDVARDFIKENNFKGILIDKDYIRNKRNLNRFVLEAFPSSQYKWDSTSNFIIITF